MKAMIVSVHSNTIPEGYSHFLILKDEGFNVGPSWGNPWNGTIIDNQGRAVVVGYNGYPNMKSLMLSSTSPGLSEAKYYGIAGTLDELTRWKDEKDDGYDTIIIEHLKSSGTPHTISSSIEKPVTGPIDDFVKAYSNSEEVFVKQADQKVAQSQAAINSKRIYKLEQAVAERKPLAKKVAQMQRMLADFDKIKKELDQARELQKLLKKLR